MFFCNADTIVAYFNQHMFLIGLIDTGHNIAVLLTIFIGIDYQIINYLTDLFFIRKYSNRIFTTLFNAAFDLPFGEFDGQCFKYFLE